MKNWQSLIFTILLFSLSACSLASQSEQKTLSVAYCDLVENPSQYDGQEIRVRATYITGFEWAFLSDEKCPGDAANSTKAWIIIPADAVLCEDAAPINRTSPPQIKRTQSLAREITITGLFHNSRGGHLGGSIHDGVCLFERYRKMAGRGIIMQEFLLNPQLASRKTGWLTMRAPDLGYAPRFLSIFLACAESRFEGESTLPPQAGNAHR